jgi:uncharacterized protein
MTVAIVCAALLGLLLFGLGLAVSMTRNQTGTIIGHSADPTDHLHKMVRAHANTAEYAPMLAVLILLVGAHQPSAWMVWTFVLATLSRYLIVVGLITCPSLAETHPLRFAGALGTYLMGLALVVAALLSLSR